MQTVATGLLDTCVSAGLGNKLTAVVTAEILGFSPKVVSRV